MNAILGGIVVLALFCLRSYDLLPAQVAQEGICASSKKKHKAPPNLEVQQEGDSFADRFILRTY